MGFKSDGEVAFRGFAYVIMEDKVVYDKLIKIGSLSFLRHPILIEKCKLAPKITSDPQVDPPQPRSNQKKVSLLESLGQESQETQPTLKSFHPYILNHKLINNVFRNNEDSRGFKTQPPTRQFYTTINKFEQASQAQITQNQHRPNSSLDRLITNQSHHLLQNQRIDHQQFEASSSFNSEEDLDKLIKMRDIFKVSAQLYMQCGLLPKHGNHLEVSSSGVDVTIPDIWSGPLFRATGEQLKSIHSLIFKNPRLNTRNKIASF